MVSVAFISAIIREKTERKTVCSAMFYNAIEAFSMIRTGYFWTDTFFYIWTRHITYLPLLQVQNANADLRQDIFHDLLRLKTSASHESKENCHHKDDDILRITTVLKK